jgi:hypothetical protein
MGLRARLASGRLRLFDMVKREERAFGGPSRRLPCAANGMRYRVATCPRGGAISRCISAAFAAAGPRPFAMRVSAGSTFPDHAPQTFRDFLNYSFTASSALNAARPPRQSCGDSCPFPRFVPVWLTTPQRRGRNLLQRDLPWCRGPPPSPVRHDAAAMSGAGRGAADFRAVKDWLPE